jgi:hypothetical protein
MSSRILYYFLQNLQLTVVPTKQLSAFSQLSAHSSFFTADFAQLIFRNLQLNQTHP